MGNIRKWLALAGLIALLPLSHANAEQCQLKQIASLDMVTNPYGRLIVPVTLASSPSKMMVDTGGYTSSIFNDTVDALKLERNEVSPAIGIYTANGEKLSHYALVPSISIGPTTAENVQLLIYDDWTSKDGIVGILAPDLLRNFDVDLDFGRKKVNLFSPDHCKGKVVYWTRGYSAIPARISQIGHIEFEVELDGHRLWAGFDTGTNVTTVSLPIADKIFGLIPDSPDVKPVKNAGQPVYYTTAFKNLSIQELNIPNPAIELLPDNIHERAKKDVPDRDWNVPGALPNMPDLILGMDVIHQLHVYIAYKEQMLYISPADAD